MEKLEQLLKIMQEIRDELRMVNSNIENLNFSVTN